MLFSCRHVVTAAAFVAALVGVADAAERVRDRVDIMESDLRDAQQRLATQQEESNALLAQVSELRALLGLDGKGGLTPADLSARLDDVERTLRVLAENQRDDASRLTILSDQVEAVFRNQAAMQSRINSGAPVPSPDAPVSTVPDDAITLLRPPPVTQPTTDANSRDGAASPGARSPVEGDAPLADPQEIYQAARADYGRGSYEMAIAGFEEFLASFPQSDLADNALYWIGECHFAQGRYTEALEVFTKLTSRHRDSEKVADAEYKRGLCMLEMDHQADGILQLQRVRDAYPDTAASRLARQRLQALGLDASGR